jgi:hypothetical protein
MQARVGLGAEWLDAQIAEHVVEPGWRAKINLRTFDMTNPCRCVLGQVFGNYWEALDELAPEDDMRAPLDSDDETVLDWEVDRGFNLPRGQDTDEDWDALEIAWVNYLRDDASWSRAGARVGDER